MVLLGNAAPRVCGSSAKVLSMPEYCQVRKCCAFFFFFFNILLLLLLLLHILLFSSSFLFCYISLPPSLSPSFTSIALLSLTKIILTHNLSLLLLLWGFVFWYEPQRPFVYISIAAAFIGHPLFLRGWVGAVGFDGVAIAVASSMWLQAALLVLHIKYNSPSNPSERWLYYFDGVYVTMTHHYNSSL